MKFLKLSIAFCLVLAVHAGFAQITVTPTAAGIVFVNKSVNGDNSSNGRGNSWTNAVKELADALVAAHSNANIKQIWVAKGIYNPLYSPDDSRFGIPDPNPSFNTFFLVNNVQLYGGFSGLGTETDISQRDSSLNNGTILNGVNGNDTACHIILSVGNSSTTVLNSFTITGGHTLVINGVLVNGQGISTLDGGGIFCDYQSSPTIANCTFSNNYALFGGSIGNDLSSSPSITNCNFINNSANSAAGIGNSSSSSPVINNCTFSNNSAFYGAAIGNYASSSPVITGCTFTDNNGYLGGGIYNENRSLPVITDCTFTRDTATGEGGGIYNRDSATSPIITNCTFNNNQGGYGGGIGNEHRASPAVTGCKFTGNQAPYGGGIYSDSSKPTIDNCIFTNNIASNIGRAIFNNDETSALIRNTLFDEDGTVPSPYSSMTTIGNDNSSLLTMYNCTLYSSDNNNLYFMRNSSNSNANIYNSILYYTGGSSMSAIYNDPDGSSSTVEYSDVEGNAVYPGTGNINANPLFANAASGDFSLQPSSAAINTGSNALYLPYSGDISTDLDLAGSPRVQHGVIDMGAYESPYTITRNITPDVNGIVYVNKSVSGGNGTGVDWQNAVQELADALVVARSNTNITQIWVAKGNYNPLYSPDDSHFGDPDLDPRNNAFLLVSNVRLYGGFSGSGTEINITQRDSVNNNTFLNGVDKNNDTAFHVVLSFDNTGTTALNGFTITGSNADIYRPNYKGVTVNGRGAYNSGGGMFLNLSSPVITNCTFSNNLGAGNGGGIHNDNASSPTITNCTFTNNGAYAGGGIGNSSSSSPLIANCTFNNNTQVLVGAGISNNSGSSPTITGCTFTSDTASWGGGIFNADQGTSPIISGCTFNNNHGEGGGICNYSSSSPIITYCTFTGNSVATAFGGAIYNNQASSAIIKNCIFTDNKENYSGDGTGKSGGGGIMNNGTPSVIINCSFAGGQVLGVGGGIYNANSSVATVINCTITGNTASNGSGGGIYDSAGSNAIVYNSILYGDTGGELVNDATSSSTVAFSDVQGDAVYPGAGNINANPLFYGVLTGNSSDFSFQSASPAINAGSNILYTGAGGNLATDEDLLGNPRLYGDSIDMGAYEYQSPKTTPVTGLNLTTQIQGNNNVLLSWSTFTEINSKSFTVQRSAGNGNNYENINTQPTKAVNGSSTTLLAYTFIDANVSSGSYAYRIMETDINGSTQYSNTVQVAITAGINVYPNPANSVINVVLPAGAENVTYRLFGTDGRMVKEGTTDSQSNYGQIPVSDIVPGMYLLQIIINNKIQTYKVQVQH